MTGDRPRVAPLQHHLPVLSLLTCEMGASLGTAGVHACEARGAGPRGEPC